MVNKNVTLKDRSYTYNGTYWLTGITETAGTGGSITYLYDNNGNSMRKTDANAVMNRADEIGHDLRRAGAMDQSISGQYNASHAEKQSIVHNPNASQIDVSRPMCTCCQCFFKAESAAQNRPIRVSDPNYLRTFNPDGTIDLVPNKVE